MMFLLGFVIGLLAGCAVGAAVLLLKMFPNGRLY